MLKFAIFQSKAIFIAALIIALLSSACSNSANSNVGVWYQNTPSPTPPARAPSVEPTAQPATSPPTAAISPSPDAEASPSPVDDPFVKDDNTLVKNDADSKNNTAPAETSETLMIPVVGIKHEDLRNTFDDARSEGRVHDAIDIMAAGGTPIVAAASGKIIKFFDSDKGGITIYELSPDQQTVYYYAHLQRRADNLQENASVKQGDLIGYVGDTGNAGAGNFHLHFAIWTITDPKHFYDGANINPYPLLKEGKIAVQ